jgi:aminoglycoside 3-N-acetyltransferase
MAAGGAVVTADDLASAIGRLGLADKIIEIHVSLKSFPRIEGGPAALVDAFLSSGCTVVMWTSAHETFRVPAPPDDRPHRNGVDYAAEDAHVKAVPWLGMSDVYDETRTETDPWLGATSAHVARRPDRVRSKRPVGTVSAVGPHARRMIAAETAEDVFGPLRALAGSPDGRVLLMGVSLTRMTILHLAEIEAGRRPFIHWARGADGRAVRYMAGACSEGFDNLADDLANHETHTRVGNSRWRLYQASDTVRIAAAAIRRTPSITHCPDPTCIECADAIAGGPID